MHKEPPALYHSLVLDRCATVCRVLTILVVLVTAVIAFYQFRAVQQFSGTGLMGGAGAFQYLPLFLSLGYGLVIAFVFFVASQLLLFLDNCNAAAIERNRRLGELVAELRRNTAAAPLESL